MKHPFIKSAPKNDDREHFSNEILCVICKRNELDHSENATCENCGNIADCDFKNGILVCASCSILPSITKITTLAPYTPPLVNPPADMPELEIERYTIDELERIKDDLADIDMSSQRIENKVHRENAYTTFKTSEDFFNAQTESILELESRVMSDESLGSKEERYFEMGRQVRARIMHFQDVITQAIDVQLECASNQRAGLVYLNRIVGELRTEYREKLHLESIDYVPRSAPKTVSRIKTSKTDKMIEQIASVMKIPIAQAKIIYENQLKASGIVCTCKETPGICRVHQ